MTYDLDEARARVAGLDRPSAAEVHAQVAALARPRMTGTEGAAEVTQAVRDRFESLGYHTRSLPFHFSSWPGRFGLPAAGFVMAAMGGVGGWLTATDHPTAALLVLLLGLALILLPFRFLSRALRSLPFGRQEGVNLLFTRPDARPSWILMAHRDSKSQALPTALRTAALVVGVATWVGLVAIAATWFLGPAFEFDTAAVVAGALLAVCGLALAFSIAANTSPGALDNATGVAALLAVAERLDGPGDVAFLITDAEELGLAGAKAAASLLPPVQGVINVDGLDDEGTFYVAEGKGWRRTGSAPQLAAALLTAGRALDVPIHRRRLPRSLLVDHLPIAEAGIPALTLLRGTWRSLLRVHRPEDDAGRLRGTGAADGATLLAAALHLLRPAATPHGVDKAPYLASDPTVGP